MHHQWVCDIRKFECWLVEIVVDKAQGDENPDGIVNYVEDLSRPTTKYTAIYTINIASTMVMLYKILPIGKVAQISR